MQKHSSADFWRPICQISSFFSVSQLVLRMCLLWIKILSKIRTSRYLSSLRMQRKESDKRRNNVFGLKCLQVLLNKIFFIHDKNKNIIFEEKYIFFKFQLDKNSYYKKLFLRLAKCSQQFEKYEDEISNTVSLRKKNTFNLIP